MKTINETISGLEEDKSIIAKMVMITPSVAAELLLRNTCNRKISASVVEKYKIENQMGEWRKSSA